MGVERSKENSVIRNEKPIVDGKNVIFDWDWRTDQPGVYKAATFGGSNKLPDYPEFALSVFESEPLVINTYHYLELEGRFAAGNSPNDTFEAYLDFYRDGQVLNKQKLFDIKNQGEWSFQMPFENYTYDGNAAFNLRGSTLRIVFTKKTPEGAVTSDGIKITINTSDPNREDYPTLPPPTTTPSASTNAATTKSASTKSATTASASTTKSASSGGTGGGSTGNTVRPFGLQTNSNITTQAASNTFLYVGIGVFVVFLLGGGGVGYYYYNKSKNKK